MKYMPNGGCGVVSFVLKGGRSAAEGVHEAADFGGD